MPDGSEPGYRLAGWGEDEGDTRVEVIHVGLFLSAIP